MIREQEEAGGGIFLKPNLPIMQAIVDPVHRETETLGQLRHGERARNLPGMRLMRGEKAAMFQAQSLHGTH